MGAAAGLLITSLVLWRMPSYSKSDFGILYILFVLFIITTGLRVHNVLGKIAQRIEKGRFIAIKLLLVTFLFSMLVTNDVALLTIAPLTVLLNVPKKEWLIIMEALAANAGSALSPFGNPQNLYIYWHYNIPFSDFITTIAPFSIAFLALLLIGVLAIRAAGHPPETQEKKPFSSSSYFYIAALVIFALAILRALPLAIGGLVILFALIKDRASLRVDYALLLTFGCFFGFTDNLQVIFGALLTHPQHVFLLSAFLSQIISNVPTALLLADFTPHWQSLLWGVSVGGFGSLVGSLANLIAYRIYIRSEREKSRSFIMKFHIASYSAFFIGILLYVIVLAA